MAKRKKQLNLKLILLLLVIIVIILVLVALMNLAKSTQTEDPKNNTSDGVGFSNKDLGKIVTDLHNMTEEERIEYYCGKFFKLLDREDYKSAYELLYADYKENFFPTYENFKKYIEEYFPQDISLNYQNIERLGDIYVLWISVKDTVNGSKYGKNFDMNVVIQENDYDNFVLSFSRDSAVNTAGKEE